MIKKILLTIFILTATTGWAFAYVGPGAGLSLLGALWGLLLAIGAALAFVIFWPLRRLMRRLREKRESENANEGSAPFPGETADKDSISSIKK